MGVAGSCFSSPARMSPACSSHVPQRVNGRLPCDSPLARAGAGSYGSSSSRASHSRLPERLWASAWRGRSRARWSTHFERTLPGRVRSHAEWERARVFRSAGGRHRPDLRLGSGVFRIAQGQAERRTSVRAHRRSEDEHEAVAPAAVPRHAAGGVVAGARRCRRPLRTHADESSATRSRILVRARPRRWSGSWCNAAGSTD